MSTGRGTPNVWKLQTSFLSVSGAAEPFSDAVADAMERGGWSPADVFAVRLALEEAVANAVEHGNKRDASKSVAVCAEVEERRVFLAVRDEGPGFDASATPDPRLDENLEKPTGRGLLLIGNFMSKVWRNDVGNEIFMEKTPS